MPKFYQSFLLMIVIVVVGLFMSGYTGYAIFDRMHPDFEDMSPEEMHDKITKNRRQAIELATDRGDYKCCIYPGCTMCYDKGNKWNYGEEGKCFCDAFIANGEEPCPQCHNALSCESNSSDVNECKIL